jgi:hypothetical protein
MLSSLRNRIALSKSKTSSSGSSKETKPTKSKVTKSTTNRYKKNTTRINKENIQIKSKNNNNNKDQEEMKSSSPSLTTTTTSSQQLTGSFDKLKLESQLVAGSLFQTNNNANNKIEPTTDNTPRFADECEYRMNHSKRGIALIINNKNFDPRIDMVIVFLY